MAYKYTTGSVNRGDLYAESTVDSDGNTYINFGDDSIGLVAGGVDFLKVVESTQDKVHFNDDGGDVDFIVESPNESTAIYLNAGNEVLHLNHGQSNFRTKIHNTNDEVLTVTNEGAVFNDDSHADIDFRVESDSNTHMLFVDAGTNRVGIGTTSPSDVLHISATDAAVRIQKSDSTNTHGDIVMGGNGLYLYSRADSSDGLYSFNGFGAGSATEFMRIAGDGKVGIGTTSPVSTFEVQGSQGGKYTAISSTGTTALGAAHFVVDYTGDGAATFTLPATSGCTGRMYHIICNNQDDETSLTIDPNGTEKISGTQVENGEDTTITIDGATPQSVSIVSTGTKWFILHDGREEDHG